MWKRAIRDRGRPAQRAARTAPHLRLGPARRGKTIKALAAHLGHADTGFTLRVYTHRSPTGEDRTRRAIDAAFADDPDEPPLTPRRPGDGMIMILGPFPDLFVQVSGGTSTTWR
ncbi:hypothetical protein KRMM14A1259_15710 [Krasilnikovia sp. MM14-A1259]